MAENIGLDVCGLSSCTRVCPSNMTEFYVKFHCKETARNEGIVTLRFLTGNFGAWIESTAERFNAERRNVNVEIVSIALAELSPNVINEATSKTGLFDGFITPPTVMGSIVEEDGWTNLKPYIEASGSLVQDWSDILLSYRKWISQYQDQILMYPLDGDVLSLFYRKDVLDAFGLEVPRTWEEYNDVAAATHGREFKNQTLIGSCVGRVVGCAGAYWANLVLSSMTQTAGTSTGHLFDPRNMSPLLGEALPKALEWMERQATYGPQDEFQDCIPLNDRMIEGQCVLTYNWGNTFAVHLNAGSIFNEPGYEFGVARTPGSTVVLDRDTMKLVPCDKERCRFGTYYDDIGWVNHAPYLAFGGWSCAVNNYTTPGKKELAVEFCAYAASRSESMKQVVDNATTRIGGADPYRSSHLDVDAWVTNGYERSSVEAYFATIREALNSDNCVTDIRFPSSSSIYTLLDIEFHDYLNGTVSGQIPETSRPAIRKAICERLDAKWRDIIAEFDSQVSSRSSTLLQYQKLQGVYVVQYNSNYLSNGIIAYGYSIAALTLFASVACGIWTYKNRTSSVVRASQPFFLILISVGVFVFSASIIPMAMDDGHFSVEACDKACMAVPWLAAMGWSILFSALYAKIRRVNLMIRNAKNFRTVRVSEKDVMTPFAIVFTANLILLLVWTIVDPLYWERRVINATESYGTCASDPQSVAWKVISAFLCALNGAALIGANVEAWKARKISTEYGESSYIGLIMGSMLQVVLVGVPLSFLVHENPTARFFVNSSMAFVICMSVLSLLFVPKILTVRSRSKSRNKQGDTKTSRGDNSQSIAGSTALVEDLKARIQNLQHLLDEAGIDGQAYIKQAGLDKVALPTTRSMAPLGLNGSESLGRESSRQREPSLPPVAEGDEDECKDFEQIENAFRQEQAVTYGPSTRTSISRWLERKRTEQSSQSSESGFVDLPTRIDMAGSVESTICSTHHEIP